MNPRREKERPPAGEAGKSATVAAVRQQHTGNHPEDASPEDAGRPDEKRRPYGADEFGGTRAGAENVEPTPGRGKPRNR